MNIHEFWKAVLVQDENEIRKYFHEDAYVNWHCTNEHFNLDEYIIANCEYPGEWNGVVERTEEMGNLLVTNHVLHCEYTSTGENLPFLEEEYEVATENGGFQMNGRWSDNPIVL